MDEANSGSSENDIEGIVELTFSIDDEKFGERDTIDLIMVDRLTFLDSISVSFATASRYLLATVVALVSHTVTHKLT